MAHWPSVVFFWNCDSEILFLQPKPSKKKGFELYPMRKSFPQPPMAPASWEDKGFFCYAFVMKTSTLGSRWPVIWIMISKTYPVDSGISRKYLDFFPFIPQTWKEGIRGCGSINLVLFDVLNIHFTADFCDSSPENCGLFEESIDVCLMEQTVRKPSVAVHLSEHLRTLSTF